MPGPTKKEIKELSITIGTVVNQQWKVIKKLGEGGCGVVYQVKNQANGNDAALKAEPFGMLKDDELLKMEVFVLKSMEKSKHVCKLLATGKGSNFCFMVMSLVGRSLGDLRKMSPQQRFNMPTTLHIGLESLSSIEEMHEAGFIHRDIKPSNFAMGLKSRRQVIILDFGLARQIMISENGKMKLREPRKNVPFKGTVRYCSLNVHRREDCGRHDDLWSWLYMMIEMLQGELPWKNLERNETEKEKENSEKKLLSAVPKEFTLMVRALKKLNYNKKPDYKQFKSLVETIAKKKRCNLCENLPWEAGGNLAHAFGPKAGVANVRKTAQNAKSVDEKRELDQQTMNGQLKTCADIKEIKEGTFDDADEDEEHADASHVSGRSQTDDTLGGVNDI